MYRNKKISLYLPCRNEASNLPTVIKSIPKFVDEIIVISNLSTDDSVKVAKKLGAKVIEDDRTKRGIGYGFAHQSGIAAATGDIIVAADADGTYPIAKVQAIIDNLLDKNLDFISCSRYPMQAGTSIPLKLRVGVWLLNTEVRILYGVKVKDILSGMWILRRGSVEQLSLSEGDWNLSPQIKINALTNPLIAAMEMPIPQYQRLGKTHQSYLRTGLSHAIWILKNRLRGYTIADSQPSLVDEIQETVD